MSEKAHWMPWYIRDWIADTRHLSLEARGAYRELLDYQWLHGCLSDDEETLQRQVAATDKEWKRVWPLLLAYFPVDETDGRRRNRKLERVRTYHTGKRNAGSTGGSTKASNTRSRTASKGASTPGSETATPETEVRDRDRTPPPGGGGEPRAAATALPEDLASWLPADYHEDLLATLRASQRPFADVATLRQFLQEPEQHGVKGPVLGREIGEAIRDGARKGYKPSAASLKVGIEKARKTAVVATPAPDSLSGLDRAIAWMEGGK